VDRPRDDWGESEACITLLPPYGAHSVRGLDTFNDIEVVFVFHRVEWRSPHRGWRCASLRGRGR